MPHSDLRLKIMAALQIAMVGMVKPNLRSVLISYSASDIFTRFVYDASFTADDVEDVSCIETELMAHFYPEFNVECSAESIQPSIKIMPRSGEVMVFHRAESRDYLA